MLNDGGAHARMTETMRILDTYGPAFEQFRRHHFARNSALARSRKYGVSPDAVEAMVQAHDGRCYVCKKRSGKRGLNLDHCHTTGVVRKMLCTRCNTALGILEDREFFPKLVAYLDEHSTPIELERRRRKRSKP